MIDDAPIIIIRNRERETYRAYERYIFSLSEWYNARKAHASLSWWKIIAYARLYPKLEITIEERNNTFCPVEITFPLMCLYVT